jgi:hypothetical protein
MVMLCLAKNSLTLRAACHGALSWCKSQVLEDYLFVRQFPMNSISKVLQNSYVDSLIHGLALRKKLVMHQTLRIKESDQRSSMDMGPFLNREYHPNVLDRLNGNGQ